MTGWGPAKSRFELWPPQCHRLRVPKWGVGQMYRHQGGEPSHTLPRKALAAIDQRPRGRHEDLPQFPAAREF